MRRTFLSKAFRQVAEAVDYAAIILISCLSALWLLVTGKRKH